MCALCPLLGLELSEKDRKTMLLGMIAEIKARHPWEYLCATMGESERAFYDLDSPLRRG